MERATGWVLTSLGAASMEAVFKHEIKIAFRLAEGGRGIAQDFKIELVAREAGGSANNPRWEMAEFLFAQLKKSVEADAKKLHVKVRTALPLCYTPRIP